MPVAYINDDIARVLNARMRKIDFVKNDLPGKVWMLLSAGEGNSVYNKKHMENSGLIIVVLPT
ncbi:MAG: hypothetical protein ACLQBQ_11790 [Smithella sp.]